MNTDNLKIIFRNYIRKFDIINNEEHNENYKWRLAAPKQFPDLINPDDPNFVANLKRIASRHVSYNLFNDRWHFPLTALIKCAETKEGAVRTLFRELFVDDGGSLPMRQGKIDAFITASDALIAETYPGRKDLKRFHNDLRTVMSYLFFHDPDNHYLYKYKQARIFAQCVGFEDDWGYGPYFKMDVYYRMCDELVEAIRAYPPLLEATQRRYQEAPWNEQPLHEDANYHILAFDLIWGTGIDHPHYNFGEKLEDSTPPPSQ